MTNETETNLEAIIEHDAIYALPDGSSIAKYIVIRAPKTTPRNDGTIFRDIVKDSSKLVLVSFSQSSHYKISCRYIGKIRGITGKDISPLDILGGGILTIDSENKQIRTFGKSEGYGEPNRDLVEKILRAAYPNYTLDVQVTDEVRD